MMWEINFQRRYLTSIVRHTHTHKVSQTTVLYIAQQCATAVSLFLISQRDILYKHKAVWDFLQLIFSIEKEMPS